MKRLTPKIYARLLYEIVKDKTHSEIPAVLKKFVQLIVRYHQLSYGQRIIDEFNRYAQEQENEYDAEIMTAKALSSSEKHRITEVLTNTISKKIILKENIDKKLLGGIKIKVGDRLIDGSVRAQLDQLKDKMIKA